MRKNLGSPPPTRGKLGYRGRCVIVVGITPAYAGKTVKKRHRLSHARDHPRLRGENNRQYRSQCHSKGSPPPTRGKPFRKSPIRARKRITPAYAGKTLEENGLEISAEDHPRLRGENLAFVYTKCY